MHATIHIGTVKTGTTSMQHFLHANRELLREQGCLYPQCLYHPVLSRIRKLTDHNQLSMQLAHNYPGDFLTPLKAELSDSGCRQLLISAEGLSVDMKERPQLQRLRDFLQELGCTSAAFVVYLRETGAMFASMCSEGLRFGRREYVHLLRPQADPRHHFVLDYKGLLQRWAEVFGREHLQVRLFERECFVQGDLLHDAIAAFDLKWDERFVTPLLC